MFRATQIRPVFAAVALGAFVSCTFAPCVIAQRAQKAGGHTSRGEKHSYQREVEKLELECREAQLKGDVATMDRLLADDYIGITSQGLVVTKQQQLDRVKNRSAVINKLDVTDVKVKVAGTTAIVTSRVNIDGTNEGVSVTGMYRYTRVYTRMPGGIWKIVNFEATRIPMSGEGRNSASIMPPPGV